MDTLPEAGQDPLEAAFERHLRHPSRSARHHWQELLGPTAYRQWLTLARRLGHPPALRRDSPRVLILPGLLGSTLGPARPAGHTLWFNPVAIALGDLPRLALPDTEDCRAIAALPFVYLGLRWRLRHAGFRVAYWPYDWRHPAATTAQRLLAHLAREPTGPQHLVAHSFGGLVATAATVLDPESHRIDRVVTLGTPFRGSCAAQRALQGDDPLVRRLAWLDLHHSAAELRVSPLATWPALTTLAALTSADTPAGLVLPVATRLGCVAGTGHRTAAGKMPDGRDRHTRAGDGTVTVPSATAPAAHGHACVAINGGHGSLPNLPAAARAVIAFLRGGRFPRLTRCGVARRAATGSRAMAPTDWAQLPAADRWRFLAEWVAPIAGAAPRLEPPPLPRRDVYCGPPDEAPVDLIVVGVFRHVAPAGLARALGVSEAARAVLAAGQFGARIGEVHALGARQRQAPVVLVGLGDFDRLGPEVIEQATAAVFLWLRQRRVARVGLGLFGTGSGMARRTALIAQLRGMGRGAWPASVCWLTRHRQRAAWLRRQLGLSTPGEAGPHRRQDRGHPLPDYLLVRQEQEGRRTVLRATLLRGQTKAALPTGCRPLEARLQTQVFAPLAGGAGTAGIEAAGRALAALLPEPVTTALANAGSLPLVVVHDLAASRWPWETLTLGPAQHRPALVGGLSRHLESPALDAARWQRLRPTTQPVPVLLVANPTEDLAGAEEEGERLAALWSGDPRLALTILRGREATRSRVLEALRSGRFDLVHYAGHALFDEVRPGDSGLLCARRERLRGSDLAGLALPPRLLLANACESGRVRRAGDGLRRAALSAGLAEAFLGAGIAHYLGTWWPVTDGPAARFATVFHARLLAGDSCGAAVLAARRGVQKAGSADWADYLHYGDPATVLLPR